MSDSMKPPWERFADVFAPKDSSLWLEISTSVRLACKEHAEAESFVRDAALAQRDKALDRVAQLTAENQKLRAALETVLKQVRYLEDADHRGFVEAMNLQPWSESAKVIEAALATTSAPVVVPLATTQLESDAEALAGLLESAVRTLRDKQYETGVSYNLIVNSEAVLCNYRSRHPLP